MKWQVRKHVKLCKASWSVPKTSTIFAHDGIWLFNTCMKHTTPQINKAKRAGFRWEQDQTTTTYELQLTHAERKNIDQIQPLTCWRLGSGEMCRTIQHWKNDKTHTEKTRTYPIHTTCDTCAYARICISVYDGLVLSSCVFFWASQRVKERLRSTSTFVFSIVKDKIR